MYSLSQKERNLQIFYLSYRPGNSEENKSEIMVFKPMNYTKLYWMNQVCIRVINNKERNRHLESPYIPDKDINN